MKIAFFQSASDFREWLALNHDKVHEVWVGFYKKKSGKIGVSYPQAVDEALCFGWIDGVKKAVDDVSYTHRFTPRNLKSFWSAVNIERVAELKRLGSMMPSGLKAFAGRDEQKAMQYSYERSSCKLSGAHQKQFRGSAKAWEFLPGPTSRISANGELVGD